MRVCLIYSGWLRTYDQCRQNHADNLVIPGEVCVVDYNETHGDLCPFSRKDFEHYRVNKAPETEPENTVNMWWNMWHAWSQAPQDCDCYVRCRYDIIFNGPVVFEQYPMLDNTVYIPEGNDYRDGINDQFAFGNRQSMEKYFSVYLNHERYFQEGKEFHSESYLKYNLDALGVNIVRIPVSHYILRNP